MRAVDTNVLARWVLRDEPVQTALADRILSEPSRISLTVLIELGWVLGKALRLPRATVAGMLTTVLELEGATIERREGLGWALQQYRAGADWADAVHLIASADAASSFATFDRELARKLGRVSALPIELLKTTA